MTEQKIVYKKLLFTFQNGDTEKLQVPEVDYASLHNALRGVVEVDAEGNKKTENPASWDAIVFTTGNKMYRFTHVRKVEFV